MTDKKIETYKLNELIDKEEEDLNSITSNILAILFMIETNFINKKIEYFYKPTVKSPQKKLSVVFLAESIMHLLGIAAYAESQPIMLGDDKTPSYAKDFYEDYRKDSLEFDKCWVESLTKVKDKLKVLEHLPELITENVRIGESGTYINLSFSNLIRTNRKILGIAVTPTEMSFSVPKSALNLSEDTRATKDKALNSVVRCSKIVIHKRLENGTWQREKTIPFEINKTKKKKNKKTTKSKSKANT